MPKASKVGKFRAAAKATSRDVRGAPLTSQHLGQKQGASEDAVPTNKPDDNKKDVLSRGQKKRQAKREQYLKREKMVSFICCVDTMFIGFLVRVSILIIVYSTEIQPHHVLHCRSCHLSV